MGTAKKKIGARLGSAAVSSEGAENILCAATAAAVLAGLAANAGLGWWWLDPVVGLGIAALAVREGTEAWRGEDWDRLMLALLLVVAALGLSNFAAAIIIGVSGTGTPTRLRVGIILGIVLRDCDQLMSDSLFPFSQVTLAHAAQALEGTYDIKVEVIGIAAQCPPCRCQRHRASRLCAE